MFSCVDFMNLFTTWQLLYCIFFFITNFLIMQLYWSLLYLFGIILLTVCMLHCILLFALFIFLYVYLLTADCKFKVCCTYATIYRNKFKYTMYVFISTLHYLGLVKKLNTNYTYFFIKERKHSMNRLATKVNQLLYI